MTKQELNTLILNAMDDKNTMTRPLITDMIKGIVEISGDNSEAELKLWTNEILVEQFDFHPEPFPNSYNTSSIFHLKVI